MIQSLRALRTTPRRTAFIPIKVPREGIRTGMGSGLSPQTSSRHIKPVHKGVDEARWVIGGAIIVDRFGPSRRCERSNPDAGLCPLLTGYPPKRNPSNPAFYAVWLKLAEALAIPEASFDVFIVLRNMLARSPLSRTGRDRVFS